MATYIWVNFDLDDGRLLDSTKPLPGPIVTTGSSDDMHVYIYIHFM